MLATTRFVAVTAEIFFSIVSGLVLEQALVSRGAADLSTQIAGLFSLSVRVSQLALEPDDVVQCDDADGRRIRVAGFCSRSDLARRPARQRQFAFLTAREKCAAVAFDNGSRRSDIRGSEQSGPK